MADKFDPYREALVMETETIWPEEFEHLDDSERAGVGERLHADPENAGHLEYLRTHSGFCRTITVTQDDLDRVTS